MPVCVYEVLENGIPSGEFLKVEHPHGQDFLQIHPYTGQKLIRRIESPHLNLEHSEKKDKKLNESQFVEKRGFIKYEKDAATGKYHKVAGLRGPDEFHPKEVL